MEEYPIYAFRTRVGTMTRQPVGLYDDWTVVTEGGSLSAHYENTILITEGEPEILSLRPGLE